MNIKFLAVTTLALGATVFAANSHAVEATATSTATVITPIEINASADLAFGSFAPGAGGTVTVSTSGARTASASGAVLSALDGTSTAAQFDVIGQPNATYSITIASSALINGAESMALTTFNDLTGAGATSGDVGAGTLTVGGTQSIYVGGTLTVAADQVAGDYAGTVAVDVEYN